MRNFKLNICLQKCKYWRHLLWLKDITCWSKKPW